MKRVLLTIMLAVATGITAFAGPSSSSDRAQSHFTANFGKASNVSWKRDSQYDKVSFVSNGEAMQAFYNSDGDLIGTSKRYDFDKLPKRAINTITTEYTYPSFQLKECINFTTADGDSKYYVSLKTDKGLVALEIGTDGTVGLFMNEL